MFEATGRLKGRRVELLWEDGEVTGDAQAIAEMRALIVRQGGRIGPVGGPYVTSDHFQSPLATAVLMSQIFDRPPDPKFSGDVPQIPPVPASAVP